MITMHSLRCLTSACFQMLLIYICHVQKSWNLGAQNCYVTIQIHPSCIVPKYDIDMHGSTKCCLVTGILVEVSCDHVDGYNVIIVWHNVYTCAPDGAGDNTSDLSCYQVFLFSLYISDQIKTLERFIIHHQVDSHTSLWLLAYIIRAYTGNFFEHD